LGRPTAEHPHARRIQARPAFNERQFVERTDLLGKREKPREIDEIVI
jgi:hypothetical protein